MILTQYIDLTSTINFRSSGTLRNVKSYLRLERKYDKITVNFDLCDGNNSHLDGYHLLYITPEGLMPYRDIGDSYEYISTIETDDEKRRLIVEGIDLV